MSDELFSRVSNSPCWFCLLDERVLRNVGVVLKLYVFCNILCLIEMSSAKFSFQMKFVVCNI